MSRIAVIVGAGLATRLTPISTVIPKVLVNWYHDPILIHQIDLYRNILKADEIIVLVPEYDVGVVEAFLLDKGVEGIEVLGIDKPLGSAYAISECCKYGRNLDSENVVFNWSDVLPFPSCSYKAYSEQGFWDRDVVYTFGKESRYQFKEGLMQNVGSTGGNVIGVYQFRDFKPIDSEGDLVEVYDLFNHEQEDLLDVVDIGDMTKLLQAHRIEIRSRSFNALEIKQDEVIKTSLDESSRLLQSKEVAWYQEMSKHVPFDGVRVADFIRWDDNKLALERIFGRCLSEYQGPLLNSYINDLVSFTKEFPVSIRPDPWIVREDYEIEFLRKVHTRNEAIGNLLDQFAHIRVINNIRIDMNVPDLIRETYEQILKYAPTEYSLIHGDPNFSNIIVEESIEYENGSRSDGLVLIDPRGYFGTTNLYGPRDYDLAKYLYAMSGYDKFNHQPDWAGLRINGDSAFVAIEPLVENWEKHPRFGRVHRLMVGVIWMCLAGYFKNNPYKSLAAYFYGLYLMRKNLS